MASSLNFSVVFQAITQGFNAGVKGATDAFTQSTKAITASAEETQRVTDSLSAKMRDVFKSTTAKDAVTAIKAVTTELNNTKQGAALTSTELTNLGKAGKGAMSLLAADLRVAQAELKVLRSSKATPADLDAAKAKVAGLKDELARAGVAFGQMQAASAAAMRRATVSASEAEDASKKATTAIYGLLNLKTSGTLRSEIAAITRSLDTFVKSSGAPAEEIRRVTAAAQAQIAQLKAGAGEATQSMNGLGGSIRSIGGTVAALTGIGLGLAGVKRGVEEVIAATIRYQAAMKQLEFAIGSVEGARKEYEYILDLTKRLGLDLNSATSGFAKLAAATKGTALEGEKTRVVFEGVASAAASLNLSADETSGVMLALSQMVSKGKVSMEELRGQLGERLPGAMSIAAKSLNMTTAELEKMVEGGMDSVQFLEVFGPAMVKAFGPTAANNIKSVQGQINLLRTEFEQALIKLGKGGVGDAVVEVLGDIRGAINQVTSAIEGMDPATVEAVKEIFNQLYSVVDETFSTLTSAIAEVADALDGLLSGVAGVVSGFDGMDDATEKVGSLTRALQGIGVLIGFFNDGIKATSILFSLTLGAAQAFFAGVATGLSKITFGDLSRDLARFAADMEEKAGKSFEEAGRKAMEFESAAVAAADRAVGAHVKAADETAAAHAASAKESEKSQGEIATAAETSATAVAGAHKDAATAVVASQQDMAAGASAAQKVIQLESAAGAKAVVSIATAGQEVSKAVKDLAKESAISLPATKMAASDLAAVLGEVAGKSEQAAVALGSNLKNAIDGLSAKDLATMWDGYTRGLLTANASTELIGKTTTIFAETAVKALGGDLTAALGALSTGFADNVALLDRLSGSLETLKAQSVDAGVVMTQALDGMLGKAKNATEINELIKRWETLGKQGAISGRQMAEGLEVARKKLDDVKPGINSVNEALRTFGLTANDSAKNLQVKYQEAFRVLRDSGVATFAQITTSLKAMMDAASDPSGLAQLAQQFRDLGNQGKIASYDVKQGLADILNKMDDMKPGINSLGEAFRTFGMKTREESAALADKFGEAFTRMRDSGQATTGELRKAFTSYAEAAIAANGGVVDETLRAEAAALRMKIAFDDAGNVIVEPLKQGAEAAENLGMSLERAIDQYGRLSAAKQQAAEKAVAAQEKELEMQERLMDNEKKRVDLENKRRNVDANGFSLDKNGQTLVAQGTTWMSVWNSLKGYGIEDGRAKEMATKLADREDKMGNWAGLERERERKNMFETYSEIIRRVAEDELKGSLSINTGADGKGKTQGGSGTQSSADSGTASGSGVAITFTDPKGNTAQVRTQKGTTAQDVLKVIQNAGGTAAFRSS